MSGTVVSDVHNVVNVSLEPREKAVFRWRKWLVFIISQCKVPIQVPNNRPGSSTIITGS